MGTSPRAFWSKARRYQPWQSSPSYILRGWCMGQARRRGTQHSKSNADAAPLPPQKAVAPVQQRSNLQELCPNGIKSRALGRIWAAACGQGRTDRAMKPSTSTGIPSWAAPRCTQVGARLCCRDLETAPSTHGFRGGCQVRFDADTGHVRSRPPCVRYQRRRSRYRGPGQHQRPCSSKAQTGVAAVMLFPTPILPPITSRQS